MNQELLREYADSHPYPLLFSTVSGAHLYGFDSPDSDYDLRGVHILPADELFSLKPRRETVIREDVKHGVELDIVTHDIEKFFKLLLKKNGYVLEQLYSPLIVTSTDEHAELKQIARGCVTKNHVYHYRGFALNEWKLFCKGKPKIKPLLYVFRVLYTGIHMMKTGEVEANLPRLLDIYGGDEFKELIEQKRAGTEKGELREADLSHFEVRFEELGNRLDEEAASSSLPETNNCRDELDDLLIRVRRKMLQV